MAFCPAPRDLGMVGGIVETVDCHIRTLVHESYRELVGPDTWFAGAFTGMLTIYIALLGYQILVGRGGLRVTELPFTALKIGLILAFLTSWAAYQTLIFNLLFDGPAQLMQALVGPLAAQGSGFDGDVMGGLERAFNDLSKAAETYGGMASPTANLLQGGPMLGSGLLWLTSITLLLMTLGLIVAAKIVLAFLLAVGPVFIGMVLFEATRGLFDGWFRATLSFAMAPLAVNVFGAVMLMILQPFLEILAGDAARLKFDMGAVITVGLIVAVFAIVMLFGLGAVSGIARGFSSSRQAGDGPSMRRLPAPDAPAGAPPSERAESIAARIAMTDRTRGFDAVAARQTGEIYSRRTGEIADAMTASAAPVIVSDRLGQAYNRMPRVSARAREEN
ncbi:MAG: type IV secretion system protein [Alphaproteobacteria bacterium]|nr:type IV secretion system protein [Alphaproteobacteria bacterium]